MTNILLGSLIIFTRKRSIANILYGTAVYSTALWVLSMFFFRFSQDQNSFYLWSRILYVAGVLIATGFLNFTFHFPEEKRLSWKRSLLWIPAIAFGGYAIFPGGLIPSAIILDGIRYVTFDRFWYALYSLLIIVYFFWAFANLLMSLRGEVNSMTRGQILYVFWGVLISATIGIIGDLILPYFGNFSLYLVGPIMTVIMVSFISYGITKHRLFQARVILTELATGLVLIASAAEILLSQTTQELFIRLLFFVLIATGGIILIKSVLREIDQKDQIAKLAEQLKVANEHLKELDKMKTEFVSLASHELLTPISAIEGYLSMLLDEKIVDPKSPKGLEYLSRIYGAAKRLAKLVTDLLNVSRIEEGRLLIQSKALDINQMIDTVIGELKFKAQEKGLAINWQPDQWPLVFADDDKLKEVLVNLIGNGIKYTQKGAVSIKAEVVPTSAIQAIDQKQSQIAREPGGDESLSHHVEEARRKLIGERQLVVQVKDSGIGVSPDEIINLFRKFYRIGDITTQQTQGTGLGLYISRSLVEMMHGRIWVESEGKAKGTTFSFSLPLDSYEPQIKKAEESIKVSETAKPLAHSSQFEF